MGNRKREIVNLSPNSRKRKDEKCRKREYNIQTLALITLIYVQAVLKVYKTFRRKDKKRRRKRKGRKTHPKTPNDTTLANYTLYKLS